MNADLRRLAPWFGLVLLVALLAFLNPRMFFGSELESAPAPSFTLPIASGEGQGDRVELRALRGKVVLLDFWASWCGPCRQSIPILNRVLARFHDKPVEFLGVNVEPELGPRRLMMAHQAFGATFPTVQDPDGQVQGSYGVTALPTIVVVDREGVVRHVHTGVPPEERLASVISDLLEGH